jgi:hypothetical protein
VLYEPVVARWTADEPNTVLYDPLVRFRRQWSPTDTLLLAPPFPCWLYDPIAMFDDPVHPLKFWFPMAMQSVDVVM